MDVFALTTYGLENVSAAEIAALDGVTVTGTGYRRITAQAGSLPPLLSLRTVDDLYLDVGTWEGIRHTRDMLAALQWYAAGLDLDAAVDAVESVRQIAPLPTFSITASFVGKRNYNADEIKKTASQGIRESYDWRYTADDREADLNLRIFIEHEMAYVGIRLSKNPLHERPYRVSERPGSLKATVAAAMLRLADVQAGQTLLDPCCGTGTIPIEGALLGLVASGSDNDPEAIEAAVANAAAAQQTLSLNVRDARQLPLARASVDRVVTNLPWGKQVTVDSALATFYAEACAEIERVVQRGGQVAILTSLPDLVQFASLTPTQSLEISLYGQRPTICLYTKPS